MNNTQLKTSLAYIQIIGLAIKEAGKEGIPSGHLYSMVMNKINLNDYNKVIELLTRQEIICNTGHLLTFNQY